jgi:hypothetical protein
MTMTPPLKIGLLAVAFVALGVAAIAGWLRKPEPAEQAAASYHATDTEPVARGIGTEPSTPVAPATPAAPTQQGYDQYGQPLGTAPAPQYYPGQSYPPAQAYGPDVSRTPSLPAYAGHHYVRTIRPREVAAAPVYEASPINERDGQADRYDTRHGRHKRSKGTSAAIVAGSAGVGAAIGAIAGGGKGAGIGALAGGAGGFVYDRLTHNH